MKVAKGITRKAFKEKFGTKEQCLNYLVQKKWSFGFICRRCKNDRFSVGKKAQNRRCTKCGYDESPTSNTLFHKVKFGIENAFEMTFDIATSKKGASSIWLAEKYGVKQNTSWFFRHKVQLAMKSSENFPLENEVHVDEFEIGTPQKREQGRSKSEKKIRVIIAVEYRNGTVGRGYAKVIDDYSCKSLKPIFEVHIKQDAKVVTAGWSGYKPLLKNYPNLKQRLSNKGENFTMLHLQIRNFKNWLRGVHSYCSKTNLYKYIDEYFYRLNRLKFRNSMFCKLIDRMCVHQPTNYKSVIHNVT